MPAFPFYKFSPSGNTTLFLLGKINSASGAYCRLALGPEGICAEQCAMAEVDSQTLQMGGGEFCANACRAFGALLALLEDPCAHEDSFHFDVRVSGSTEPVSLLVSGKSPLWQVAATFSIKDSHIEKIAKGVLLVRLPGINHLLLSDAWPELDQIPSLAAQARHIYQLPSCPANGIVWWKEEETRLEILPYVEVPASGTAMLESSCGSASLALALAQAELTGKNNFLVRQPSGDELAIKLESGNKATLAGEVRLCAKGKLFLPFP